MLYQVSIKVRMYPLTRNDHITGSTKVLQKNIQLNRNFIFARKKDVHITMHYVELIINTADKPCS